MIIYISVKPNSKEQKVEKINEKEYKISLKEKPIEGKANIALIKILSREFNVCYKKIKILNPSSRKKIVEIDTESVKV